jgi:LysM repeat protein
MLVMSVSLVASDKRLTRNEYIDQWKDEAIYQMVVFGIPASITLAQGILESGDGNSKLATEARNHFGIKCHSDWKGKKVYHDDDKRNECFRKYPDARDSFEDHSQFLQKKRYSSLFDYKITDYKNWAKGLKKCGYATNPKYAKLLIELIEENDLAQYDRIGVHLIKSGDVPDRDEPMASKKSKKDRKSKKTAASQTMTVDESLPSVKIRFTREIHTTPNFVEYVVAGDGDSLAKIAEDLDMMLWQLKKYNDLDSIISVEEGQRIYIKPKRGRSKTDIYTVLDGETMWDISQKFGVKLSSLYNKNNMTSGSQPKAGDKLSLKKRIRLE